MCQRPAASSISSTQQPLQFAETLYVHVGKRTSVNYELYVNAGLKPKLAEILFRASDLQHTVRQQGYEVKDAGRKSN